MRADPGAALLLLSLCLGCRPDPTQPPDPDEPTPALPCADAPVLSLVELGAPSALPWPAWTYACSACPLSATGIQFHHGDVEISTFSTWADGGTCVAASPAAPPPAVPMISYVLRVADERGSGEVESAFPLRGGRGPDPAEVGTYRLAPALPALPRGVRALGAGDLALDRSLVPFAAAAPDFSSFEDLLVDIGAPGTDGRRPILLGSARPDGAQDLCRPTQAWSAGATTDQRALTASLSPGDSTPGATLFAGGVLHATLLDDGSALADVTLLAQVDLNLVEGMFGTAPDALCADLAARFGRSLCGPCTPPDEGLSGVPSCLVTAWEWLSAPRLPDRLIPIYADAHPSECLGDDDSAQP
jgi:hypothetical protein